MDLGSTTIEGFVKLIKVFFPTGSAQQYKAEEPLRSELYSSEQMAQHSKTLAKSHIVSKKKLPDQLLARLADNEKVLVEVRNLLTQSIKENYQITPAGEWLLDNFYLIEEQIRTAKKHLPKKYSEGLPQLSNGSSVGLPRVYDIAQEIISHSDGHVDMESLNNFIDAYQTVTHFKLGELWALPIMLRLALIENLRRVSSRIGLDKINRLLADNWAKRMIDTADRDPKNLILDIADLARSNPPIERAFVAELMRQLHGKGPALMQPLNWIEERLAETGQTISELVQSENQHLAADQVSVSNSIGSLRLLGSMNWRDFVEKNSIVEQILLEDKIYGLMDFSSRDRYRHVVESISKNSDLQEWNIARIVVELAKRRIEKDGLDSRTVHVGYFLVDDGRFETETEAKMELPLVARLRRFVGRWPLVIYLGAIFVITFGITALIVLKTYNDGEVLWGGITLGVISVICVSQLAVGLVNFFTMLIVHPELLPRMDFSNGIPEDACTMVVVPTLLANHAQVEDLVEALEVRFLANKEENLYFALLTDFTDAHEKELPEDGPLLQWAAQKIDELNQKYPRDNNEAFYLFHRPREWDAAEHIWMGHERKRGKLTELNALLRGGSRDCFSYISGGYDIFPRIKYVITLDTDTQLPRDSAGKIIGAMAHPLNRPVYSEKKRRVVKGYGILQPRVSLSMPGPDTTLYARMNGNEPGIDPYTRTTSDVYQDLFGEGSFIGKGIYEVDTFEKTLKGQFPENRILSHDLVEGCYVRSGLISDVQLYEKHPAQYYTDMQRRYRWVRGDLQIAAWVLPLVPRHDQHWYRNPLSALSRWKIFDNIRRSMVPGAFTAFVLLAWTMTHLAAFWTLIITAVIILPVVVSSLWDLLRKPKDLILSHHIIVSGRSAGNSAIVTLFTMICLPYEAYINTEAILRTTWRMLVSHRHLLDWVSFEHFDGKQSQSLLRSYLFMFIEPLLAIVSGVCLFVYWPANFKIAAPILLLWLFAPLITWRVSQPFLRQAARISEEGIVFLQKLARKTWSFFEEFVTATENWLPPDNFQEIPNKVLAHRTSPTNIGLSLLANLTAYDFGYITVSELITRTEGTLNTMQKLERFRGHFYNWNNTLTLTPLYPKYISSVDSGNLTGHLLTLRQGLFALPDQQASRLKLLDGIRDTLAVLIDLADKNNLLKLNKLKEDFERSFPPAPAMFSDVYDRLLTLQNNFQSVRVNLHSEPGSETERWIDSLSRQIKKTIDEMLLLAPWLGLHVTPAKFNDLLALVNMPTLRELANMHATLKNEIGRLRTDNNSSAETEWLNTFEASVAKAGKHADKMIDVLQSLAQQCMEFTELEYDFLYDRSKHLLSIGYNAEDHRADAGYYDLLASEARLGAFVGIAQGKLPQESWFALSRLLTYAGGRPILLSWSGSMFEYLMPLLVMPSYENTLLNQTDDAAVVRQIDYGKERGVPWGISESCYNMVDAALNYQYRAFGVPGLGLQRGLGEDLVIAPYATALALMIAPDKACQNLQNMSELGFQGKYGFYEAVDYTPSRLPRGQDNVIVQSYMAHHQGMSLLSISYVLHNKPMQKRFEADPQFQSTMLLLQERIPKATSLFEHTSNIATVITPATEPKIRVLKTANTPLPGVQLLSNGNYHVMVTNSGGGYSRWRDISLTRWREDVTRDNWGTFCYIRDVEKKTFWSTTYQPTMHKLNDLEISFSQGRADYSSSRNQLDTHTEIVVSPEDDIEMRRLHIINRSNRPRTIEITSYAEVVMAPSAADMSHMAFSNLFVQTEILPNSNAIICTRRPRSAEEKQPGMFHLMNISGKEVEAISYETDRMAFIGRGNTLEDPQAMRTSGLLSGSQGSVLDPIVSIRYRITMEANEAVIVDMMLGIGETREICQGLVDKYQDKHHKDRVFELAWTHNQVVLRQINASEADAQLYTRMANSIIYLNPALRAEPGILMKNHRGQSGLWPYSISGDLPIVLLKIGEQADIDLVKQMLQAHTFWRLKGLAVDLIIWNDSHDVYRQVLQNEITGMLGIQPTDKPGGVFVRSAEQIPNEDRILFQSVARVIITSDGGSLTDHVNRKATAKGSIPDLVPRQTYIPANAATMSLPDDLIFFNGLGGFSWDGREYIIHITGNKRTPAPWVNVIANPNFGTIISESGQCYTWKENAHEMRITPWENDPVSDAGGEAFYLRDEETGHFWGATPLPCGDESAYIARHGFGYSVFIHEEAGIRSEMWVYVDVEAAIKFSVIKIKNNSDRPRKISATGYVEWVLGELRPKTVMHIATELDPESGAIFARNPYDTEFGGRVAFFDVNGPNKTFTADRMEFIGRNGSLKDPLAMTRTRFSGKIGVGLDPCAAIQVTIDLLAHQEKEIIFKLGEGKDTQDASNLARQFRTAGAAHDALDKVVSFWKHTVEAIQVDTPDQSVNMLVNGWLTYQTLSCRLWGRSGYYQSGGAFGFRDQLQDVISLLHTKPQLTREHILLSASRQFQEGDVQHWWHPPTGRGVRTHCSDDFLWLPFATAKYIQATGDTEVLNEMIPYLQGRLLNADEDSYYDIFTYSDGSTNLYDHCVRAIKHAFRYGIHGLPLMGTGDWNDGMDRVGKQGKGESVWLAFFLYDILMQFIPIAETQGDHAFATICTVESTSLKENIEKNGWDGQWYRRAYFDDGTPLGSATNDECQIDSLAQSWAVISGAGESGRTARGMESADQRLVRPKDRLIQLLDPAFDKSHLEPGYIKGYVPGVRENGGQYTQAAIWLLMAFARSGNNKRAWELLDMINPINHTKNTKDVAVYKVEPYVMAADVYAFAPHIGRGGWTWYTGSAGWTYQLITGSLLGLKLEGDKLNFAPCIPSHWETFKVRYRYKNTFYRIIFIQKNGEGEMSIKVDGTDKNGTGIQLADDGIEHAVEVNIFSGTPSYTGKAI